MSNPYISAATYDAETGILVITGDGFRSAEGTDNDIVASKFTITGEGGTTYTLTDTTNVDITSSTLFTLQLSEEDMDGISRVFNKNGTVSTGGTPYNLAATRGWSAATDQASDYADLTSNFLSLSNAPVPMISSAHLDFSTGKLTVNGTGFMWLAGDNNDIVASKFILSGKAGTTHALTDTADVDISWGDTFVLSLGANDKAKAATLFNKDGSQASDEIAYNVSAAEDWNAGADVSLELADLTGNPLTVSNSLPDLTDNPPPTSATLVLPSGLPATTETFTSNGITQTNITVPEITQEIIEAINPVKTTVDIPIVQNNGINSMTASLPAGVGLQVTVKSSLDATRSLSNSVLSQYSSAIARLQPTQTGSGWLGLAEIKISIPPALGLTQPPAIALTETSPASPNLNNLGSTLVVLDIPDAAIAPEVEIRNVSTLLLIGSAILSMGSGANHVLADRGSQSIVLGPGDDVLFGGDGDDTVGSGSGNDRLYGDEGSDVVFGGADDDTLTGGSGDDDLDGNEANNTASYSDSSAGVFVSLAKKGWQETRGAGKDRLINIQNLEGSPFDDTLTGDRENNVFDGLAGNDIINGDAGNDTIQYINATAGVTVNLGKGKAASSIIRFDAGIGTDKLKAIENIIGGDHSDMLTGTKGGNVIAGQAGNDTLDGGEGRDTLSGGIGADHFVFNGKPTLRNIDVITDFEVRVDKVVLNSKVFSKLKGLSDVAENFVTNPASNTTDFLIFDRTLGRLFYDADGKGTGKTVEIVNVGNMDLSASDILIS